MDPTEDPNKDLTEKKHLPEPPELRLLPAELRHAHAYLPLHSAYPGEGKVARSEPMFAYLVPCKDGRITLEYN